MTAITYISSSGEETVVEVDDGASLMEAALENGIDGIVGECGGFAMCATCHIFIESAEIALPLIKEIEDDMLNNTAEQRRPNSRLACQIRSALQLDGLVVRLPESQYE